ncbi:MAG: hypothetical protein IT328_12505 [Caldilineaceae bacterium]|nr:hypothetical protein [Caldilineaceae bacterium]
MFREQLHSNQPLSKRRYLTLLILAAMILTLLLDTPPSHGQPLAQGAATIAAFPGAEGFGAQSVGGRGGKVIEVTNLNDAGDGSLRACIQASGPRICVFRVAGTIALNSKLEITNPYITIAGQTAPGGGITLKSADPTTDVHMHVRTHEVIIRYLRFRPGTRQTNGRALTFNNGQAAPNAVHNVVVDHVSMSWAGDEILILWGQTNNITVQWSMLTESLPNSLESGSTGLKGPNLGDERGGGAYTLHHNLLAHHTQRFPKINTAGGPVDLVNNVMYNMGTLGAIVQSPAQVNFVNNYIKAGPNTRINAFLDFQGGQYHASGNVLQGVANFSKSSDPVAATRFAAPAITTTSGEIAYDQVLSTSGAYQGLACDGTWFARRDAVDTRIAQSVVDGTRGHNIDPSATVNGLGYITNPEDVRGWPNLDPGTPCADTDHDGMPDIWETQNGLNPAADDSAQDKDGDGYTNIEEYINGTANSGSPNPPAATAMPLPPATSTPVGAPTPVPTSTPVPPGTPPDSPVSEGLIFVSSTSSGKIGNISFADEDVLAYDMNIGAWSIFFDGSDVLPTQVDVDGFWQMDDNSLLLSFDTPANIGTLGQVDDSDIVRFIPTSLGSNTAGTFEWYFDGSDVGLASDSEDIDALTLLDDGRLVISTIGEVRVPGLPKLRDEDLLVFNATQLGETTSGTWELYFEGSAVGLDTRSSEDVNGIWIDQANGHHYLTTIGAFEVPEVSGSGADVFVCVNGAAAPDASCAFQMYWEGAAHGIAGEKTDALYIARGEQQVVGATLAAWWTTEHDGAGDDPAADPDEGPDEASEDLQEQQLLLPFVQN